MKYENKKRVDEICKQIDSFDSDIKALSGSGMVSFESLAGFRVLGLYIDANKERDERLYLTQHVRDFQSKIIESMSAEVKKLLDELEKL